LRSLVPGGLHAIVANIRSPIGHADQVRDVLDRAGHWNDAERVVRQCSMTFERRTQLMSMAYLLRVAVRVPGRIAGYIVLRRV
jgi:hypothetical protein